MRIVTHAPGLIWRPVAKAGNEAYFVLKSAGFTPRMYDYEAMTAEELLACPVLWIVSDEYMEMNVQENLADYVRGGGKLIVNGRVPDRTREGETCTLLGEALGVDIERTPFSEEFQRKLLLEGREYFIGTNVQPVKVREPFDMESEMRGSSGFKSERETEASVRILAATEEGRSAALLVSCGEGQCLILPFALEMSFWGLAEAVQKLLESISVQPHIQGAKMLRVIPKAGGYVIVMNLHPVEVTEDITLVTENGQKRITPKLAPHSFVMV